MSPEPGIAKMKALSVLKPDRYTAAKLTFAAVLTVLVLYTPLLSVPSAAVAALAYGLLIERIKRQDGEEE